MRYPNLTVRRRLRALALAGVVVAGLGTTASVAVAAVPTDGGGSSVAGPAAAEISAPVPVLADGLRFRSAGNLNGDVEGLLYTSDQVNVIAASTDLDGGTWYEVSLPESSTGGLGAGSVGWVYAAYVGTPSTVPGDGYYGPGNPVAGHN
ncbi:SH3 domain-containing protein [Streptomyces sp. NPDC020096]